MIEVENIWNLHVVENEYICLHVHVKSCYSPPLVLLQVWAVPFLPSVLQHSLTHSICSLQF